MLKHLNNGLFEPNDFFYPAFSGIIPSEESLKENYRKVFLTVPKWFSSVSKREENAYLSIVLAETPILAIGNFYENGSNINLNYLKSLVGKEIDIYVPTSNPLNVRRPFVVLPHGQEYNNAEWFSLIMVITRNTNNSGPSYL